MTWENEFKPAVLEQGLSIYRHNRVSSFYSSARKARGIIMDGPQRYHASVEMDEWNNYVLNCTCYNAMRGYACEHEAAVLYAWKGPSEDFPQPDTHAEIWPEGTFDGCFFNPVKALKDFDFTASMVEEARRILENGGIEFKRISCEYRYRRFGEEEQVLELNAEVPYEEPYRRKAYLNITLGKDRLMHAVCERCASYYSEGFQNTRTKALCVHHIAALIHLGDYILKNNPGDETNRQGLALLEQFGQMRVHEASVSADGEKHPIVHLAPKLNYDGRELSLSFRVGAEKLYVLKDITALVNAVENGETMKLGKSNEINFSRETIARDSADYYQFIEDRVRETKAVSLMIQKRLSYYNVGDINLKGTIDLVGAALDEFYDLAVDETVDFDGVYASGRSLHVGESRFSYDLTISELKTNGTFSGVTITGENLQLLEGAQYRYFLQDGHLSRLDKEDAQVLEPFLSQSDFHGLRLQIGVRNLSEFYYRILPKLKEHAVLNIHEPDQPLIARQLPPEAQFSFYLDLSDDQMFCRALAVYGEEICTLDDGSTNTVKAVYRDRTMEDKAVETVKSLFPYYDPTGIFTAPKDDDSLYTLLDTGINELMAIGTVHASDEFQRLKIRRAPSIQVGVSVASSLMDLEVFSQELTPEQLLEILASYRQKKRFHRLNGDEFIMLEQDESLDTLSAMMEAMNIDLRQFVEGKLHLPLYRALYIDKMLEDHESLVADRDRSFRNLVRTFNTIRDSEYDVPEELEGTLRNYQMYGYKWMHTLMDTGFGGILADDMGLGKTVQTITLLAAAKKEGKLEHPALIICPTSVVYNWEEEFRKFAPKMEVRTVTGKLSERKHILSIAGSYDVLITSYELLRRDIGCYEDHTFSFQIIDEGQFIKNPKAAVSKAVRIIKSEHRFALTGTPIENRLSELWSIFDFLMPGFLYTYENFRSWFETPITKDKDEVITEQLRRMVSPFILRRLKQDVLKDLPPKTEEIRYARFEENQQKLYDGQVVYMRKMVENLDEHSGENKIRILAELMKIREICCDPSLVAENYTGGSAKREACMDLIQSGIDGDHKMLVFSQFTSMLELLEDDLNKAGIRYYKITGATSKEDRMSFVHKFNEDDTPVFLISLKAGGTGLNLTGADIVIHYDPWWNIAAQNQATDRAHRIGQTRSVSVFKLIVKDSIEERILEMQEAKKDLSDAILSGETTSLSSLSKEELLEILG